MFFNASAKIFLIILFYSGTILLAAIHHNNFTHSPGTKCYLLLKTFSDPKIPSDKTILNQNTKVIVNFTNALKAKYYVDKENPAATWELVTGFTEEEMTRTQLYGNSETHFKHKYYKSSYPLGFQRFKIVPLTKPYEDLYTLAMLSKGGREFMKFIIYFKNGDSLSSPISLGTRKSVYINHRYLTRALKQIAAGRIRDAQGIPQNLKDIKTIERVHNHPRTFMLKVSSKDPLFKKEVFPDIKNNTFWFGPMGLSSPRDYDSFAFEIWQVFMGQNLLTKEQLNAITFRNNVINSKGQILSFDFSYKTVIRRAIKVYD